MKGTVMFICANVLLYGTFFTHFVRADIKNDTNIESSCNQAECLRCDLEVAQCVKCLYVIVEDTRRCVKNCPTGFDPIWSRSTHVFGRMCAERSVLSLVSQRQVGIIAGASLLGAICVGILLGILVLHRKGTKSAPGSPPRALPRSLQDKRPKTEEINVKGKEKEEFISRLRLLRSDAPQIFRMMAETRNRFKGGSGPDNPSETRTKACKAVVRDLSRVLCLLSRKEDHLKTAPKDWDRLLAWTERLLIRYKRQQELKELGEKGEESPSPVGYGRHLFVTRQEKVQEDRRRWIQRTPPSDQKTQFDFHDGMDFSANVFDFSRKDDIDRKTSEEISIPDTPPPKMTLTPLNSTENLLPKRTPDGKRKKKKDLLHLNKQIWSRLTTSRENSTARSNSMSSNDDVEKATNSCNLEINLTNDDFGSQNFFDHIEAFAFDLGQDTIEEVNENYKNNKKLRRTEMKNIDNIWKEPFRPRKLSVITLNQPSKLRFAKSKTSTGKENRPSRIRRISSSLLRKNRSLKAPGEEDPSRPKKRRPITRQKQVEKDKKIVIRERLRKTTPSQCSSMDSQISSTNSELPISLISPNNIDLSNNYGSQTSRVDQVIEGDDVYLQVTRTPVMMHQTKTFLPSNSTDRQISQNNQISTSKDPYKAYCSSTDNSRPSNLSNSSTTPVIVCQIPKTNWQPNRRKSHNINTNAGPFFTAARRHTLAQDAFFNSKNTIPRCEILTNV